MVSTIVSYKQILLAVYVIIGITYCHDSLGCQDDVCYAHLFLGAGLDAWNVLCTLCVDR